MTGQEHPGWCNRNHATTTDPRRQDHLRTWRPPASSWKLELLPLPGMYVPPRSSHPEVVIEVVTQRSGGVGRMFAVLTLDEVRELGRALTEVADASEAETVTRADALGVKAWW